MNKMSKIMRSIMGDFDKMMVPHNRVRSLQSGTAWGDRVNIIENNFQGINHNVKRFYKNVPNSCVLSRHEYYKFCISQINPNLGLWVSMGVHEGKRERKIIEYKNLYFPELNREPLHGFDSFRGLPSDWKPGFPAGKFKMTSPPTITGCKLHIGWFSDTLPAFTEANSRETLALLHVDCDLYSSTVDTFKGLGHMITPGTVIMFDEIQGEKAHIKHEKKAFDEFAQENDLSYEWVAWMANGSQAACIIKSINNTKRRK